MNSISVEDLEIMINGKLLKSIKCVTLIISGAFMLWLHEWNHQIQNPIGPQDAVHLPHNFMGIGNVLHDSIIDDHVKKTIFDGYFVNGTHKIQWPGIAGQRPVFQILIV